MDLNRLEKLANLRDKGAITEDEFEYEKHKMMDYGDDNHDGGFSLNDKKFGMDDDSFNMLLHLSQFCSYLIPVFGIAAPLVLWLMNKDNDPIVDEHGRNILNWNLTAYLYLFCCTILIFVFIGIFLIWIPIVLSILFPIIGAMKAKDGIVWRYPFSISFL